ncbi:sperm acrosome membrane-associated protein 6 isoform X2 [Lepisosteus oculatus]|uniref:sperm acrosome membrane-associated protein 6 isoform X2 n=1 Tax=Lepisosteus oculatus TaxID=7918 RepID=UPI003723849C
MAGPGRGAGALSTVWLCLLLAGPSAGCFTCLVETGVGQRLCWGYVLPNSIRSMDACYRTLERIFGDERVIEAGRVGGGYEQQLKEIMYEVIRPVLQEFDLKRHDASVYETRLQLAAEDFTREAAKLPRGERVAVSSSLPFPPSCLPSLLHFLSCGASDCIPPCGFQARGAVYSCVTCQYASCGLPLDCPVKELAVPERNRTVLRCEVGFSLPQDLQISWKFARQVRTQNTEQFEELTLGTDRIYAIPSTRPAQEGTYLCEIFTQERSIARVYYHLTVLSQDPGGPAELQRVFDTALLSPAQSEGPPPPPALRPPGPTEGLLSALLHHTSPPLLTACLSMMVLLLLVSLGFVYWWSTQRGGRKLDWPRGAARHVERGGG